MIYVAKQILVNISIYCLISSPSQMCTPALYKMSKYVDSGFVKDFIKALQHDKRWTVLIDEHMNSLLLSKYL